MLSVCYLLSDVTKIGTWRQISIKIPKTKFHEYPSVRRGAVPCGHRRTAVQEEAKSLGARNCLRFKTKAARYEQVLHTFLQDEISAYMREVC
jgi:hypothetical protein